MRTAILRRMSTTETKMNIKLLAAKIGLVGLLGSMAVLGSAQFYGKYDSIPEAGQGRVPAQSNNAEVRVDQKLNTIVSDDIPFVDSTGKTVTTGELFSEKPTLLLMVFYQCSGVCTTELNSLIKTVKGMKKDDVGDLFNVVVVSIDPTETPELAAQKKETYLNQYDRRGTDSGWKFLVGEEKNIDKLADEVGFRFVRDKANGNITHPAALMVLSPERRLTRYFLQQEYDAKPVLLALKDAQVEKVGARDAFASFISCVNVDPLTGERSLNVMKALRLAGLATLLILVTSVIVMNRRNHKNMKIEGGSE